MLGGSFYFLSFVVFVVFLKSWGYCFSLMNMFNIFKISFLMDWVSSLFLSVLFLILGSVIFFSNFYMVGEVLRLRSFTLLVLSFVVAMVFLVTSGDWISLILGWDWLGMTSFFLVAYYNSDSSWSGSLKTYITNRMGDGFFLFMISFLMSYFIFFQVSFSFFLLMIICFLCQTKSAQLPFSAWLPAAMSAPTPVSALVHSSTLVTAGVFILIRVKKILKDVFFYLGFMGLLTLFIGSFSACGSFDVKKIVAFSTLSHLGFMFVCLSSGLVLLGFYHLIIHACFKALLFMSVGMLMIQNNHSQDFRQMGFSFVKIFYIWVGLISVVSLCGFPFFSGFFSKDFMFEVFFWNLNIIFFLIFWVSMIFSVFYSFRLILGLLKINWGVTSLELYFRGFYLVLLLLMSVVIGGCLSGYFKNFCLMSGGVVFKLMIYFFLIFGFFLYLKDLKFLFSSSMVFLDSLGGGFVKTHKMKKYILYTSVDKGFVWGEDKGWRKLNLALYFALIIKEHMFWTFWAFLFCFYLVWVW